jgi:hypothetical protein
MKRDGFALVLVLLVLAALELITVSTLTLATHESVATAAHERSLVASRAAESALRRLIRNWPPSAIDSLQVAQSTTIRDSTSAFVTVRRNNGGQYYATAFAPSGHAWIRESALLETLDLERSLQEATQAVVSAAALNAPSARFQTDTTPCLLPSGGVADTLAAAVPDYAFGGLSWSELASIADTGFVYAARDLLIPAGPYFGVLIVAGDLRFQAGADFTGVAVVGGTLTVEDGASITGSILLRSLAPPRIGAADLVYAPCAVARALQQTPAVKRLARSQRRFIPAF